MISPDPNGLYHPADEAEIIELINHAVQNKLQVRVRGAAQSVREAVYTDGYPPASGSQYVHINMQLDKMRKVEFDDTKMQVTVGGGCNLGWDPYDPSSTSTKDEKLDNAGNNNLLYQLNQRGWGIQNVPDAIHQTIAGYISTGSQAGSMMHSFDDCIVSIRLIDGTGTTRTFTKSSDLNDHFYAVGVSMGLLGVITAVTLQCVKAFNIKGQELTTSQAACEFDFLGNRNDQTASLQEYLNSTEFSRLLWWPFPTLQRMIAWKAHTLQPSEFDPNTSGSPADFKPKPYHPVFPKLFGSTLPSQAVAGTGFRMVASYPDWLLKMVGTNNPEGTQLINLINGVAPYLYPLMIDLYFPLSSHKHPAQQFWDYWNGSLPMDTIEFSDNLFNLVYTELWIPIADANKAINALNDHYVAQGMNVRNYYTIEILASKKSNFWLSPAHNGDTVRLNIMRFDTKESDDLNYYQQFWDLMKANNINFTLHWGKYLPPAFLPPASAGGNPTPNPEGPGYVTGQYAKWNDFRSLRSQMDPNNVFLTSYWKSQLGIS